MLCHVFRYGSALFCLQSTQFLLCLSQQQGKSIQVDEHLGVRRCARENAKLCNRHFSSKDIFFDGKIALVDGAKPLAEVDYKKLKIVKEPLKG